MKLALCQNQRFALPGSVTIHLCMVGLLWFFASHQVMLPPEESKGITVQLLNMAEQAATSSPAQPAPKPAPVPVAKSIAKPLRKATTPKPVTEPSPQPSKQSASQESGQAPGAVSKTDSKGAAILYQAMPKIPDDLRHEVFTTSAMARFHIAADGSATVELLTPSQSPRLNHILLETLKTWRFAPATENGEAKASTFDIRVHFAVE